MYHKTKILGYMILTSVDLLPVHISHFLRLFSVSLNSSQLHRLHRLIVLQPCICGLYPLNLLFPPSAPPRFFFDALLLFFWLMTCCRKTRPRSSAYIAYMQKTSYHWRQLSSLEWEKKKLRQHKQQFELLRSFFSFIPTFLLLVVRTKQEISLPIE